MDSVEGVAGTPFMRATRILSAFAGDELSPLIPPGAWRRLATAAAHLPLLTQTVCFECRLSGSDDRVDFACSLFPFHAADAVAQLQPLARTSEAWGRLCSFLSDWGSGASLLGIQVPFTCIALDLPEGELGVPAPCLSACIDPDFFAKRLGMVPPAFRAPDGEVLGLAEHLYLALAGSPLPVSVSERLQRCLELGDTVELKHLSVMLPRAAAPLKLNVRVSAAEVGRVLRSLHFPHADRIQQDATRFVGGGASVQLNLVLHPAGATLAELEVFTAPPGTSPEARTSFLERLVQAGLCSLEKASVLRALSEAPPQRALDSRRIGTASYVKLRLGGDGPVDAKAYLGLMPRMLRAQPHPVAVE